MVVKSLQNPPFSSLFPFTIFIPNPIFKMKNLRYFGSSNLSPLAPPFTVDRSHSNSLISNPISLSNNPSFGPSSSYSTKELIQSTAAEEFLVDFSAITSDYGYIVPDSITDSTTNWFESFDMNCNSLTPAWSAANPSPNRVIDSFYPSKVEIDDSSLVGFDFSTSGVVHRHETDYTQELSGLKYNSNPNPNPNSNPNFKKEGISIGTSLFADNSLNESHFSLRNPSTVKSSPIVIKPPPAPISTLKDTKKSSASDQMNLEFKKASASDQMSFEFKASPGDVRVPDINIPDTAASSVDYHNPAEDSPCWKGTPFLQFGSDEVLSGREEVAVLQDEIRKEAGDKEINASRIVKELCNLSDLILSACSNDGLTKHDLEALERATRNLGVYVSRKVDQSAPASAKKVLQVKKDKELLAHYKIMKADVSGVNMVQAIKKVLEENLKGEVEHLPESDGLLYKSLWLEAEAELCCLGYRGRLDRLKRGIQVQDEGAAAGSGSDWEHILKDEVS